MTEKLELQNEQVYSSDMQDAFYVEELEDRFEMAAVQEPGNGACWVILF